VDTRVVPAHIALLTIAMIAPAMAKRRIADAVLLAALCRPRHS
jgi:hypothetical protein